MLTYIDVHFKYTLPVIGILILITRPFITRSEIFKIVFISTLAIIYTVPWDNYIIYNGAWTYSPERVLAVIGYVPIEEYMFFAIQTILTSLWALLCVRWSTPCFKFNYDKHSYQMIRWIPISLLSITTIVGYRLSVPGQNTFYLGCVLCWICPVLIFMWYGGGNFFVQKIIPSSIAIIFPTLYLCWVDKVAIKNGTWHISETTSLNIFLVENLPIEEVFFFFTTNMLIVLGVCCYDKARGMMVTYTLEFPQRFNISREFIKQMFWAFMTSEYSMPSIVAQDIEKSMDVLCDASKSFSTASYLFQPGKISL